MVNYEDLAIARFMQHARQEQVVSTGRLMEPSEVKQALAGRPGHVPIGWYLTGETHPKMFATAWSESQVVQLALRFAGESGIRYLVFAQRGGDWEHRFLVQCVGEDFKRFVRETRRTGILFSLADGDGPQARVFPAPESFRDVLPAEEEILPTPGGREDIGHLLADCVRAAFVVLLPEALGEEGAASPKHVCLTVVQSPEVLAQAESILAQSRNGLQ